MKPMLLAALLFTLARPAFACINFYGTDLQGNIIEADNLVGEDLVHYLTDHPGPAKWRWEKAKRVFTRDSSNYQQRNDYAAVLLHLGEVAEALRILQTIERTNPGLYATATNLGTAYELAGDNARALQWIREGIRRNPDSHGGTEWLHAAILIAKQARAKTPITSPRARC
jgi:tetratricopeptide (TPR) repeat protein